ncbi:hypothetical protein KKF84_09725, partial [Myxococcota bacterium]|nr:hypothetical protein [Myxococcota bacterium]
QPMEKISDITITRVREQVFLANITASTDVEITTNTECFGQEKRSRPFPHCIGQFRGWWIFATIVEPDRIGGESSPAETNSRFALLPGAFMAGFWRNN